MKSLPKIQYRRTSTLRVQPEIFIYLSNISFVVYFSDFRLKWPSEFVSPSGTLAWRAEVFSLVSFHLHSDLVSCLAS